MFATTERRRMSRYYISWDSVYMAKYTYTNIMVPMMSYTVWTVALQH